MHRMRGRVAVAAEDLRGARTSLRVTERVGCQVCDLPQLARSYDLGGATGFGDRRSTNATSTTMAPTAVETDAIYLPGAQAPGRVVRGEGATRKAIEHYRTFIDLWKNADPVLQPKVTDAKQRVAALTTGADTR
jgi:hypothetical protein